MQWAGRLLRGQLDGTASDRKGAYGRSKTVHLPYPAPGENDQKDRDMKTIAVLGTLDTKGHEHAFVASVIRAQGHKTLLIDVGGLGAPQVKPDIAREEVAAATG